MSPIAWIVLLLALGAVALVLLVLYAIDWADGQMQQREEE